MANKRPELQEKIILASFMAPVAFVDHMKSPLRLFAPYAYSLEVNICEKERELMGLGSDP